MSFSDKYISIARRVLPSPLTIALLLTAVVFVLALLNGNSITETIGYWEGSLWNGNNFAFQCMFMLVVGHIIALSKPFNSLMNNLLKPIKSNGTAVLLITFVSVLSGLLNWGLGLIIGALFARKIGEYCTQKGIAINYPLIAACGYAGLMVWHGGLSGSAPLLISNSHKLSASMGEIGLDQTLFSFMNMVTALLLLIIVPIMMYFLSKYLAVNKSSITLSEENHLKNETYVGAEKLDYSAWFGRIIGALIVSYAIYRLSQIGISKMGLNHVNLCLMGLGFLLHKSLAAFLKSLDAAIVGASGILIQFPLYFGIMGIMSEGGLATELSEFFVSFSDEVTFPLFTFFSAGLVNIFVPSGGGQWAVQGPIIIDTCNTLGIDLAKSIMAMCYGDQLTNMLQPFWALPLLGITGLKAKDILPYTLILFLIGTCIFTCALLIF